MEWLNNIWIAIQNNWDAIAAGISTVTTILLIPIAKIINSQKNNIADNTSSTKELTETIKQTEELRSIVKSNTDNSNKLCQEMSTTMISMDNLKSEYVELKTAFLQVNSKLGSILDVMSIVYATVKDETVRKAVSTIINSVKYNDAAIESEVKVDEYSKNFVEVKPEIIATAPKISNDDNIVTDIPIIDAPKSASSKISNTRY